VTDSYGRSLDFTYTSNRLSSVSTPDSLVLTYGYTYYGNLGSYTGDVGTILTSVSYNTSPTTSQTYNYATTSAWPYEITSIVDENGNTATSWQYNSAGQAIWSYQGGSTQANSTSFSYSSTSTTVWNANNVADTYNYTTFDGLPELTEIDRAATYGAGATPAASEYFSADVNGFLSSFTDWNGNVTNYTNNSYGNPTSITEAYGSSVARTTTIAYDATWVRLPATITTPNVTRAFTYDGSGNVATLTDTDTTSTSSPYSTNGQTREWQMTWNGTGELLTFQMPRTDTTVKYTLTWSSGCLATLTDQLSHEWQITSTTGGCYPQTIVDPNSVTTTLAWDTRLNLNTRTVGGSYTTTWTHDPANNLASIEWPDGSTLTYTRDTANRITNITDLNGNAMNFTLDALGRSTQTTITGNTSYSHSYSYDNLERMIKQSTLGNNWFYTYDTNSNLTSVTDPQNSVTWNYTVDALNRPATKVDPTGGGTTTYTFDAHNRLTNAQDPKGNSTAYVNDGFGDVIGVTNPDMGSTVYIYDKDRNLTIRYPWHSSFNVSKTYDQGGHGYGIGRLTSVTDQPGSDSFTYDERGNITGESRVITGIGTLTTSTSYDAANRVSSITYPSGTVVDYTRDNMGLVTAISATPPGGSSTSIASSITHRSFGPVKGMTFGNGVVGIYYFYNTFLPESREDYTYTADVTNLSYGLNSDNSLTSITDTVNSSNSQSFGYDYLQRLTSATSAAGGYGTYGWTWDANSNLATQVINSTTTTVSLNSGSNQLASLAVTGGSTTTVDTTSNGNILDFKIGGTAITSYTYGQDNRLASATGPLGASASYQYGFDGQRLLKTPSSGYPITYQYAQAAKELLAENDLHSGQTADYIYMDPGRDSTPVGIVNPTSGNVYYVHTDRQGTPQAVTDSGQNVVWSAFYNPFGDTSSFSGSLTTQSLRLPGQYFDPETGNNHNGFRDYAGTLTRYVQSDPIGLGGGMNTYQYVRGNPFRFTDRRGLQPEPEPPPQIPLPPAARPPSPSSAGRPPTMSAPPGWQSDDLMDPASEAAYDYTQDPPTSNTTSAQSTLNWLAATDPDQYQQIRAYCADQQALMNGQGNQQNGGPPTSCTESDPQGLGSPPQLSPPGLCAQLSLGNN
jgi:RHS repeat-associated protein